MAQVFIRAYSSFLSQPLYMFGSARAKASSGNCSRDNKRQINIFYQNSSCPFDHSTHSKGLSEAFCAQLTFW